jgi:minimal PKS chain-length factor (CLF/KS beta)
VRTPRDAVVTGMGIVAPNGIGTEEYWAATLAGKSGLDVIQRFDSQAYPVRVGGEVLAFDAAAHLPKRLLPQTDRMTQHALVAAGWALDDADLKPEEHDEYSLGVLTASGSGGFEFGQREMQKLWGIGPERVSAYQSFAWFYAVNTGQISIRHGMRGHSSVFVTEQAGGLDAVAHAARLLGKGTLESVLTGGLEASLCPWGLVAQIPSGFLSQAGNPNRAYLPFDAEAVGYVPGEGGAMLVVERADRARERDAAAIYGKIAGHASTFDARPGSGRPAGLARAIRLALEDARINAEDVDVIFADAFGTPALDRAEAEALTDVFGSAAVPVTAPKTMTGRLYAGGSALDTATALLSIRDSVIPPTTGTEAVAPGFDIDLVLHQPREMRINTALVVARGAGGFNSALIIQRHN